MRTIAPVDAGGGAYRDPHQQRSSAELGAAATHRNAVREEPAPRPQKKRQARRFPPGDLADDKEGAAPKGQHFDFEV
jgi:hypothetical protein